MEAVIHYEAVVIGVSAGGMKVLDQIFKSLPRPYPIPIIIVMHRHPDSDTALEKHFEEAYGMKVLQVKDKDPLERATVYFAPPNYHLMLEEDQRFSLSVDRPVHFARPSIDVLFETAAEVLGCSLVGIILTGANSDGALGLKAVKKRGGLTIVQHPESAQFKEMPNAAIRETRPQLVLNPDQISEYLGSLLLVVDR